MALSETNGNKIHIFVVMAMLIKNLNEKFAQLGFFWTTDLRGGNLSKQDYKRKYRI